MPGRLPVPIGNEKGKSSDRINPHDDRVALSRSKLFRLKEQTSPSPFPFYRSPGYSRSSGKLDGCMPQHLPLFNLYRLSANARRFMMPLHYVKITLRTFGASVYMVIDDDDVCSVLSYSGALFFGFTVNVPR